jgi:hypothetical protein
MKWSQSKHKHEKVMHDYPQKVFYKTGTQPQTFLAAEVQLLTLN